MIIKGDKREESNRWQLSGLLVPSASVHVIQCKCRHFHVLSIIGLHVENNTSGYLFPRYTSNKHIASYELMR